MPFSPLTIHFKIIGTPYTTKSLAITSNKTVMKAGSTLLYERHVDLLNFPLQFTPQVYSTVQTPTVLKRDKEKNTKHFVQTFVLSFQPMMPKRPTLW